MPLPVATLRIYEGKDNTGRVVCCEVSMFPCLDPGTIRSWNSSRSPLHTLQTPQPQENRVQFTGFRQIAGTIERLRR